MAIPLEVRSDQAIFPGLERNALLNALPADAFSALRPHLMEVALAKGSVLHDAGHRIEQVYFVLEGLVSVLAVMPAGEPVEVATIGREGVVGASIAMGWDTALSRTVVQMPLMAARISTPRLTSAIQESAALRRLILAYGRSLLFQVQQVAACSALHSVQARLCRWLLHAEHRCGSVLQITQEGLSQLLGVQRTTVNMLSRGLQAEGLIRLGRGVVEIRDSAALEAKACGCYRALVAAAEEPLRGSGEAAQRPASGATGETFAGDVYSGSWKRT
jgi:CRP-like cAMP-binding protein